MENIENICVWKLNTEANKKINRSDVNNPICERCDGYKFDCKDYIIKPEWYGID